MPDSDPHGHTRCIEVGDLGHWRRPGAGDTQRWSRPEEVTMNRKNLLALGWIYVALAAVLVVTGLAASVVFVLVLAGILGVAAVACLVAGYRRPREPSAPKVTVPAVQQHSAAADWARRDVPWSPAFAPEPGPIRAYEVGVKVQFDPEGISTTRTQGHEVLLRGHTGTVTGFVGSDGVAVHWDGGPYEEYVDLVPTPSGLRVTAGDTLTLAPFDTPVNEDKLRPAGEAARPADEAVLHATTARPAAPERAAPMTAPGPGRCAACGREVLGTRAFVARAAQFGYVVDPVTGDSPTGPGQALYEALEDARGFECTSCGRTHCTACLMRTPQHPVTHGPRCPSCAEGPHQPLS